MESQKDSADQQAQWAENSQNKKAFLDKLQDQSTRWKCFVIWLFVIGTKEILQNKLTAERFFRQQILLPICKESNIFKNKKEIDWQMS